MTHYIDGFVLPIPRERMEDYRRLVKEVSAVWKAHGALDYREYVGDDLSLEGTRSFTDMVAATDDESIVFGWVVFESRAARDKANEKVAADRRMVDLMNAFDTGFDARRMAYGGFTPLVSASNGGDE